MLADLTHIPGTRDFDLVTQTAFCVRYQTQTQSPDFNSHFWRLDLLCSVVMRVPSLSLFSRLNALVLHIGWLLAHSLVHLGASSDPQVEKLSWVGTHQDTDLSSNVTTTSTLGVIGWNHMAQEIRADIQTWLNRKGSTHLKLGVCELRNDEQAGQTKHSAKCWSMNWHISRSSHGLWVLLQQTLQEEAGVVAILMCCWWSWTSYHL